jgi:hypothetical protein
VFNPLRAAAKWRWRFRQLRVRLIEEGALAGNDGAMTARSYFYVSLPSGFSPRYKGNIPHAQDAV